MPCVVVYGCHVRVIAWLVNEIRVLIAFVLTHVCPRYASAQSALNFTISAVVHAPSPAAGDAANSDEAAGEKGSKQAGGKISRKVYNKKRLREISDFIDTLRGVATPYGFRMQCKRDVLRATVSLVNQLQQQNAVRRRLSHIFARSSAPAFGFVLACFTIFSYLTVPVWYFIAHVFALAFPAAP